jgi:hypothetical protein
MLKLAHNKKNRRIIRYIIYLLIVASVGWEILDTCLIIRDFIYVNRGIEFYLEKPHLLWVCVILAPITGLFVYAIICLLLKDNIQEIDRIEMHKIPDEKEELK